jgi:HAMP domain-containing protein
MLSVAPSVRNLLQGDEFYREQVEGYIMALAEQYDIYDSVMILDTEGIITANTLGSLGGYRGDREYFQASMRGESHISGLEQARSTGRFATFLSAPVRESGEGRIIGVALIVLRLDEFNSRYVIPVGLLGDQGYAMIATSDGTVIGHRNESVIGGPMPEETMYYLDQMTEGGSNMAFESVRFGEPFMAFAERSHNIDWFAVVVCPVSQFYDSANYLALIFGILAVVLIILQAFIIWLVVRSITKSLAVTVQYSEAVAKGDLDALLDVNRNDEVGILAQSLRVMVGKLKAMINLANQRSAELEAASGTIMAGINYASKIQSNLLPKAHVFEEAFSDYSVIWKPRDIVGGDIYWLKNFESGTVLCVCDCTGHGAPGAMLTMLVTSAFEDNVNEDNCHDTANIIWQLEKRLVCGFDVDASDDDRGTNIHDGCDLAVLFIKKDGSVNFSSANFSVFVCDGEEVTRFKGQRLFVGEGMLKNKDEIKIMHIEANPNNKFYIASDGLFDQPGLREGGRSVPFGYKQFLDIILKNHVYSQNVISNRVWEAFEAYRGEEPRVDDFALITFKV